jgi:hypothetical protein
MKKYRTITGTYPILFLLVLISIVLTIDCFAEDFYIAQSAVGSGNGTSCANAKAVSYFNTSSNWAKPKLAGKIGPGDTVHVCGTITGTSGQNILTAQGSGAAGSPVTIFFEGNAILQAGYLGTNDGTNPSGGAIKLQGVNYVTVDGGTNGIIQNTANGTLLSNQVISAGIFIGQSATNIEIKNLNVKNMFVREALCNEEVGAGNVGPIVVLGGGIADINIHNNTLSEGWFNIFLSYGQMQRINIYNNIMRQCGNGCIIAGSRGNGSYIEDLNIYDNDIGGNYWHWFDPPSHGGQSNNHLNGIFLFSAHDAYINTFNIYNNYIHGDFGTTRCGTNTITAWLQVDCYHGPGGAGRICSGNVYNNLMTVDAGTGDYPPNGFISMSGAGTRTIYNNTLVGQGNGGYGIGIGYIGTETIKNNIIKSVDVAMYGISTVKLTSNYNLFYQIASPDGKFQWGINGNEYKSWAQWRALGFDANSIWESDPLFVSTLNFRLQSASPARNKGTFLSGTFTTDKNGVPRPQGPVWSIGCYEYSNSTLTTPQNFRKTQ